MSTVLVYFLCELNIYCHYFVKKGSYIFRFIYVKILADIFWCNPITDMSTCDDSILY